MRQLRELTIETFTPFNADDERGVDEVMAAIGKLERLEVLSLLDVAITSESLSHLAGLRRLKSLRLHRWNRGGQQDLERMANPCKWPALARLPVLPRLEYLGLHGEVLCADDLHVLAALPRLKAIDLSDSRYPTAEP